MKVHFQFYTRTIFNPQSPQMMFTSRVARTDILQPGQIYFLVLDFFGVVGVVGVRSGEPRPGVREMQPSSRPMRMSSHPLEIMKSIKASVGEVTDQPMRGSYSMRRSHASAVVLKRLL